MSQTKNPLATAGGIDDVLLNAAKLADPDLPVGKSHDGMDTS